MATSPVNNIKRVVRQGAIIPDASNLVDSSVSFNQGDLIGLVSGKLKAIALDADTTTMLGVAPITVVSGVPKSPYSTAVDGAQAAGAIPGPQMGVVAELVLNTGDAFAIGGLVYAIGSVDAQTVSSSSNSGARKPCGVYVGPVVASATAGQKGLVHVGAHINSVLMF
jgi:hypothetical protein